VDDGVDVSLGKEKAVDLSLGKTQRRKENARLKNKTQASHFGGKDRNTELSFPWGNIQGHSTADWKRPNHRIEGGEKTHPSHSSTNRECRSLQPTAQSTICMQWMPTKKVL
jgi:hypothetical protein